MERNMDPLVGPLAPLIAQHIERLAENLKSRGLTLATAESCTGGLVGALCTSLPGSSEWFYGGVIAYDNSLKTGLLGVPEAVLAAHGAVSPETAVAMAAGALRACGADCAVALTGVAGPDGGSPAKPVGLVVIGIATPGSPVAAHSEIFPGNRAEIRRGAARKALELLNLNLEQMQGNRQ